MFLANVGLNASHGATILASHLSSAKYRQSVVVFNFDRVCRMAQNTEFESKLVILYAGKWRSSESSSGFMVELARIIGMWPTGICRPAGHPKASQTKSLLSPRSFVVSLVRVSLGCREVSTQFFRCPAGTVAGRIALNAPTLPQRPRIDRVETELVK